MARLQELIAPTPPPPRLRESVKLQVQWKTLFQNKVTVIDEDINIHF